MRFFCPPTFFSLIVLSYLALLASNNVSAFSATKTVPRIIQGGMGIRISHWKLAREVASKGELGVVSGTSTDTVVARELQIGKLPPKENEASRPPTALQPLFLCVTNWVY